MWRDAFVGIPGREFPPPLGTSLGLGFGAKVFFGIRLRCSTNPTSTEAALRNSKTEHSVGMHWQLFGPIYSCQGLLAHRQRPLCSVSRCISYSWLSARWYMHILLMYASIVCWNPKGPKDLIIMYFGYG